MALMDFAGRWRLVRSIVPDEGAEASFDGEAILIPDGEGLRYREAGLLRLPGQGAMTAERTHLWRPGPGGVAVAFEDGRPFHAIDLTRARPAATHLCGRDLYAVSYDLSDWPRWRTEWRVDGPRKAYRMLSRYTPLAGDPPMRHPRWRTQEGSP